LRSRAAGCTYGELDAMAAAAPRSPGTNGACGPATAWPGWAPTIRRNRAAVRPGAHRRDAAAAELPAGAAEWQRLLADCTPRHLVHDAEWAEAARELARSAASLRIRRRTRAAGAAAAPDHARPDAPALLVYTSGTTGGPKAAVHTQANLLANMRIAHARRR
jgi:non-ribosomal peptide synthetase component F